MADFSDVGGSRLNAMVDDDTPRRDAIEWAAAELTAGGGFEDVAASLTDAGWDTETAADLLEQARCQTRPLRGALTRDQVATAAHRRYRQAMRTDWLAGLPTKPPPCASSTPSAASSCSAASAAGEPNQPSPCPACSLAQSFDPPNPKSIFLLT